MRLLSSDGVERDEAVEEWLGSVDVSTGRFLRNLQESFIIPASDFEDTCSVFIVFHDLFL